MKAIGLWQPWATLMAIGAKQNETRSWPINYRGPLAIQATAGFPVEARDLCATEPFKSALAAAGYHSWRELPRGAVVGVVEVYSCVITELLLIGGGITKQELAFGDYTPTRYGWMTCNARRLVKPLPWKGSQGFFDVPEELLWGHAVEAAGLFK